MKCSLGISNFLEEISSLSHSIVFLYFFALVTEGDFLISPCYSLELCMQMGISFHVVFSLSSCRLKLHEGKYGPSTELMISGISKTKLCVHFIYCVVDVICLKNECTVLLT